MSLGWRKAFTVKDGEETVGSFRLFLRKVATGLAYLCGCCPCRSWYIACLCPCGSCDAPEPLFIGDAVVVDDEHIKAETDGGKEYSLYAVTMIDHEPTDASLTDGKTAQWSCLDSVQGCRLWAIKHLTRVAPFNCGTGGSGYIDAEVIIDGVFKKLWSGSVAIGGQIYIGDGVTGETGDSECLEILHTFADGGVYNIDLKVTMVGDGADEQMIYTCRTTLRVTEQPDSVDWIGQPFVTNINTESDTRCWWNGVEPTTLIGMSMSLLVLKGPFDSEEDADEVLSYWNSFITAYAETCTCGGCLPSGSGIGRASEVEPGNGEWVLLEEAAGDNKVAPSGCNVGWVKYTDWGVSLVGSGFSIRLEVSTPAGGWTTLETIDAPGSGGVSGLLRPCQSARAMLSAGGSATGFFHFGGNSAPLVEVADCVLTDPASPYFEAAWDYDEDTHEGVPGNSAQLADYKESLEV